MFTRAATALALVTLASASPSTHHDLARRQLARRDFTLIQQNDVLKSYDYVIVGGGLAGLVLASRLSEDEDTTVIVLEAGLSGDAVKDGINSPAGAYYQSIVGSEYDWGHVTTPQPNLGDRDVYWPHGKILGGSTAMNAMYLVRPSEVELNAWADLLASDTETSDGADKWNWDNMFEAMKKSENFTPPSGESWDIGGNFAFSTENHGAGGPMQLAYPAVQMSATGNWTTALARAGVPPQEAPNGGETIGGFISPSSINPSNWTRSYSRSAYIDSLPPRENLHILAQATVTKVGFSDRKDGDNLIANTVEFADVNGEGVREGGGVRYVIGVNKEVLLAGGPMGSAKVLMHSGVGPKDVLDAVGVNVNMELSGVGQHLQDHMTAGVVWEATVETAGTLRDQNSEFSNSREFLSFINDAVAFANITRLFGENRGILQEEIRAVLANATAGTADEALSFASLVPSGSPEVIEGYKHVYNLTTDTIYPEIAQIEMLMSLISPGQISIQSALQHPYSRGRLYINSNNPFDPVVIDPNYFSHPVDRTIMRQGVKLVREVGAALREMGVVGAEIVPGPGAETDEALDAWLTYGNDFGPGASTQYHPTGSCSMLPKKWGGAVDSKLKVYGLANVRVADSAVYPFEFAAHLASATFGLAETAADLVKTQSFDVPNNAKADDAVLGKHGGAPDDASDDDDESGAQRPMAVVTLTTLVGAVFAGLLAL